MIAPFAKIIYSFRR